MFSNRVNRLQESTNPLYIERNDRLARGAPTIDLISANVTAQGLAFPKPILKKVLSGAISAASVYRPNPRGQQVAREALQAYYLESGLSIPPEQFILTPGSSLAYAYVFKLLSNPGGEILCPRPSYPLFETLATFCDVALKYYPLRPEPAENSKIARRWAIDLEAMAALITPKTRAIILVSPHNPTGAVASKTEIEALGRLAASYRLPIISDEVFSSFLYNKTDLPRVANSEAPLVFTLNGISKMFALPGYKLGWISVTGDPRLVQRALNALEFFSDTFLPVHEAIQLALPQLFDQGHSFLNRYKHEIGQRRQIALDLLSKAPGLTFIRPEGGFYLALKIEALNSNDEAIALDLLRKKGLLLHPGYLYDFESAHLVLSFTSKPEFLKEHLPKIVQYFQ